MRQIVKEVPKNNLVTINELPDNPIIGIKTTMGRAFFVEQVEGKYFMSGLTDIQGSNYNNKFDGDSLEQTLQHYIDLGYTLYLFDSVPKLYRWMAKNYS